MEAVSAAETACLRAAVEEEYPCVELGPVTIHDDRFVYSSLGIIGCAGVALDRSTDRVYVLAAGHEIDTLIWAIERGFEVGGRNLLVITRIHSLDETIDVLKMAGYSPRWFREEFTARLQTPPVTLELDCLATYGLLRVLPETRAFDYEVNP
jgi:hypothetical protein